MKRSAFWVISSTFILILVGCVGAASAGLLKGAWIDRTASFCLSKRVGLKVSLYDVGFSGALDTVRFGILSVTEPDKSRILFASGAGEARTVGGPFASRLGRRFVIRLGDIVIMEELCARNPLIHWAFRQAFDRPILIRSIRFSLGQEVRGTLLRILSCESDQLALSGGAFFEGKKAVKIHALILLPAEKFEKLPKEMRARMIRRNFGWRGVRLVYCRGLFTVSGASGPFFQAQWNRGQL